MIEQENRVKRLRFRSWHRGTREMDLLLGSFADAHLNAFSTEQLDDYEALLETPDPDLYAWMTGSVAIPADQNTDVMGLIRAHRFVKDSRVQRLNALL